MSYIEHFFFYNHIKEMSYNERDLFFFSITIYKRDVKCSNSETIT